MLFREYIAQWLLIAWSLVLLVIVVVMLTGNGVHIYEPNPWIVGAEFVLLLEVIALAIWNLTHIWRD